MKESTKQRFCALTFDYPGPEFEARIIGEEAGISEEYAEPLGEIGEKIRHLKGFGLNEGISTRLLVYTAQLIVAGLDPHVACEISIVDVLTDDPEVAGSMRDIINLYFPPEDEDSETEPETATETEA